MREFIEIAVKAARAAGRLQRERFRTDVHIDYKGEVNLVTDVDRMSEEMIVGLLRKTCPDHGFLAEEGEYGKGRAPYTWIIDPLDGTTNYAHGFPWFCVSIGLEIEGEVRVGVVYHPILDELFTVEKGKGAFLNGRPIKVSRRAPLRQCLLATGFPYDRTRENENNFAHFVDFQLSARAVRRAGAAALDLAYVAAGILDGYWELKLQPWDMAAGALLVTEAGGRVTNHAGEPFSVYDHRVLATNGLIHGEMVGVLQG